MFDLILKFSYNKSMFLLFEFVTICLSRKLICIVFVVVGGVLIVLCVFYMELVRVVEVDVVVVWCSAADVT